MDHVLLELSSMTDAEPPILWPPDVNSQFIGKDPDGGKIEGRRRRGRQRMRWLDGITNSMDMNLSKICETGEENRAWYAAIHGVRKDSVIEQQQMWDINSKTTCSLP